MEKRAEVNKFEKSLDAKINKIKNIKLSIHQKGKIAISSTVFSLLVISAIMHECKAKKSLKELGYSTDAIEAVSKKSDLPYSNLRTVLYEELILNNQKIAGLKLDSHKFENENMTFKIGPFDESDLKEYLIKNNFKNIEEALEKTTAKIEADQLKTRKTKRVIREFDAMKARKLKELLQKYE